MFSINCLEITAPYQKYKDNQHIYKNLVSDDDYKDSNGIGEKRDDLISIF